MKPKRQALNVTIEQLEKLIEELKKDGEQFNGYENYNVLNQKFLISIINKEDLSDTWELVE